MPSYIVKAATDIESAQKAQPLLVQTWVSAFANRCLCGLGSPQRHILITQTSTQTGGFIAGAIGEVLPFTWGRHFYCRRLILLCARSVYCFLSSNPAISTTCHISQLSRYLRWSIRPLWRVQVILTCFTSSRN